MSTFVWCSQGTLESAAELAKALKCEHGTVPPKDFSGTLVCYGAAPQDKFNWQARKIDYVINDPRKYRKFSVGPNKLETARVVRLFLVGPEVVKAVYIDTPSTPVSPDNTLWRAPVMNKVGDVWKQLDSPDFVTMDIAYDEKTTNFVLLKTVFGAAIVEHPDVVKSLAGFVEKKAPQKSDKDTLRDIIEKATPEEAKALRNILAGLRDSLTE